MKKVRRIVRFGFLLCFAALLSACQFQRQQARFASEPAIAKRPSVTGAVYFQQAKGASEDSERVGLLLQAASAFLAEGNRLQAGDVLQSLASQELSGESRLRLQLLQAELNLQSGHPARAKSILLRINTRDLEATPLLLEQQRNRLLTQAYRALGQGLMAVKTEVRLLDELAGGRRQANLLTLWGELSRQPLVKLQQWLLQVPRGSITAGWLQLAIIMRKDATASADWFEDIAQWRQGFPGHQASLLVPESRTPVAVQRPKHIALLLPLTGPHAQQGESVRRGFYAAYFQQRKKLGDQAPSLQVYDTNEVPMKTVLQRVREQGATDIVGPLLKQNLSVLLDNKPTGVRVLALNAVDRTARNVTQFALSPESSIDQLVAGMASAKKWRVAVLVPDTAMGERLLKRFRSDWDYYEGDIVGVFHYKKPSGYSAGIRKLLNIDQAKARENQVRRALRKKPRFVTDRRHDIDAFLLIGSRSAAQSLKPLLSFYFAGKVPVYATSQVIDNLSKKRKLADLNGLKFLATPWQVAPLSKMPMQVGEIRAQLQQTWPASTQKHGAFYAMGVDSYFILERLSMLQSIPHFSYFGETGLLSIDANGRIFPRLLWAKLLRGRPKLSGRG
jgi:uncharacterized protein